MLTKEEQRQLYNFAETGLSASQIAKKIGRSPGTILKYKRLKKDPQQEDWIHPKIPANIEPYSKFINQFWKLKKRNVSQLFREMEAQGYTGSYATLNTYVNSVHGPKKKNYKRSIRVETGAGEQAQVDWGSFGRLDVNGRKEKLYAFVYVLSYSRMMYVEFVARQNQPTLQQCHINAFEALGIPKAIRYDNMKTVILKQEKLPDGTKKMHWNPSFKDFALYYGFTLEMCPPYWPRAKGKVEAGVKYLRNSFAEGSSFKKNTKDLKELNKQVGVWLKNMANSRTHGTTKQKPEDLWLEEKPFLKFPTNLPQYQSTPLLERRASKDGIVQYKANAYSVPTPFCRKKVAIREAWEHGLPYIEIYYCNKLIAKHQLYRGRGKWIIKDEHVVQEKKKTGARQNKRKESTALEVADPIVLRDLGYYNSLI